MPAYVDHAKRREELVSVAIGLIAEGGIENASVRAIARCAGYSTVVVTHYFRNKAELLRQAFESTIEATTKRIDEAIEDGADVMEALEIFLPITPVSSQTWKVWFAFWGMALSDHDYRQAQATRGREGRDIIQRVLERCSDLSPGVAGGREMQASRLLAVIAGIAALSTFDPEGWQPQRQRAILTRELESLANESSQKPSAN